MGLTPEDVATLKGLNFAHVVTLDPDGAPHSAPTWIDVDDQGHVIVNSAVGRRKDRNIRRDPRIAVSVHRQDDPYTWLSIQGTVVSIETGEEAEKHIDTLNRRYMEGVAWEYVDGQQRVIYRIRADKVMRSD
jgi:PPOX class probable F420-dependent enzyme